MDGIVVNLNQEFEISLQCVPTAGYQWDYEPLPEGIKFMKSDTLSENKNIGGTAIQIFKFRAEKTGQYHLIFLLKRAWEKEAIEEISKSVFVK